MSGRDYKEILLVDDDADYCELTRTRLEAAGFCVSQASSGEAALAALKDEPHPDLIILDVEMADKNGLATLINLDVQWMKPGARAAPRIPILVATGLAGDKIREIMMTQKVDDFLRKPFSADQLVEKVNRLLGLKK